VTPHRRRWEHKVRKILRNEPTYRFIVEPWSLRGRELTQGFVIAAIALGLAVFAVLLSRGIIRESRVSSAIGVGALVAYITAVAFMADVRDVEMVFFVQIVLSAIGAVAIVSALQIFIPEDWNKRGRAARLGLWLAILAVIQFGVVGPIFSGARPFWMFIAMAAVVLAGLALLRPPTELAGRRMLINGIVGIWIMSMSMSAGLRQALHAAQTENGTPAQLLDLQITSGVLLTWFGGLLAFAGAVGMWAKRRDQIIAHERAQQQQEAAAESTAQLSA
jgi:hypothetical protein